MKKLFLILATTLVGIPFVYLIANAQSILFNPTISTKSTSEVSTTVSHSVSDTDDKQTSPHSADPDQISYSFAIESRINAPQQNQRTGSAFNGDISLKKGKNAQDALWYGQITNTLLQQNQQSHQWPQPIYFTARYNHFVFSDIDFLGLPATHPGHAIRFLLEQVSYQTHSPLVINQAMGTVRYQYHQSNGQVRREIVGKQFTHTQSEQQLTASEEHWALDLLANNWPGALHYNNRHDYQSEQGLLEVSQTISLKVKNKTIQWPADKFVANANARQTFNQTATTTANKITDKASLQAALLQLAKSTNKGLAKAVGEYLLKHYSDGALVNLINAQDPSSTFASLLIYAIQKAANFDAEVMLAQLYEHPELDNTNKQRVLMSMGRFEGASEQTLNALRDISDDSHKTLANTALLSIGSLAKFSQSQQPAVEDFLAEKLSESGNEAMTITAIKNSGSTVFNQKVEKMLGHQREAVNVAAIKLLSKDPKYQDKLVAYVANSGQAKSITALRTALSNQGLALTNTQKGEIEGALQQVSHPLIKQQLTALLQMDKHSW